MREAIEPADDGVEWVYEPSPEPGPRPQELFEAAGRGDLPGVLGLLDSDLMAEGGDWLMFRALQWATSSGHLDVMQALIDRGARLEYDDGDAWSPLTSALLRSGVCPGYYFQETAPDSRPLELLLRAGARYRLREAVILHDLPLARRLLDEGAGPDTGAGEYFGPVLMTAAKLGHASMAGLLLDRGANVDGIDDLHQTALMLAVENGHPAVTRLLLDRGASPRVCCLGGQDPRLRFRTLLSVARDAGHREVVNLLREQAIDWEVLEILYERDDEPGVVDTLIMPDLGLLTRLAEELVATRPTDSWAGRTPVDQKSFDSERLAMHAARLGNPPALAILFDRGAGHFYPICEDHSLITEAARHGHLDAMQLLIERGADTDAVSRDGLTPLAWAMRENRPEAVDLLRRAGATR